MPIRTIAIRASRSRRRTQELNLWMGDIVGAISQVGASRLTTYMS